MKAMISRVITVAVLVFCLRAVAVGQTAGQQPVYSSPTTQTGIPGTSVCSQFSSIAACLSALSPNSALIPPGTTGVPNQYNYVTATASCYVTLSGGISIVPLGLGKGYTSAPVVTVSSGSLAGTTTVNATVNGAAVR
jgi:hypothetical protein